MSDSSRQREIVPPPEDSGSFRAPTRREQAIGAGLFTGFGLFFGLFFIVEAGSRFRCVILALALISLYRGARHAIAALTMGNKHE